MGWGKGDVEIQLLRTVELSAVGEMLCSSVHVKSIWNNFPGKSFKKTDFQFHF